MTKRIRRGSLVRVVREYAVDENNGISTMVGALCVVISIDRFTRAYPINVIPGVCSDPDTDLGLVDNVHEVERITEDEYLVAYTVARLAGIDALSLKELREKLKET